MALASALGLAATWLGVLLAYDSYHWPPAGSDGWPVSFFIMALIFTGYLLSGPAGRLGERRAAGARISAVRTVAED